MNYSLKISYDEDPLNPREDYDHLGTMVCWHRRYNLGDRHHYENQSEFFLDVLKQQMDLPWMKKVIEDLKAEKFFNFKLQYNRSIYHWELRNYSKRCDQWFTIGTYKSLKKDIDLIVEDLLNDLDHKELHSLAQNCLVMLPLYLFDHGGITINTTGFSCSWDSGQVGYIYATPKDLVKEYGKDTPENREKARNLLEAEVECYDLYLRGECYGFQLYEDGEEIDSCWGFLGDWKDILEDIKGCLPKEAWPLLEQVTDVNQEYTLAVAV